MRKNQAIIYSLIASGFCFIILGIVVGVISMSGIGVIIMAGLVIDHFIKKNYK